MVLTIPMVGPQGPPGTTAPTTTLTDAATISIDISTGDSFAVTLGGDRTLNFTGGSAALNGKKILLRLKQDGTGSRNPVWGAMVRFGSDIPDITLTSTPSKTDIVGLIYDHSAMKYDVVAFAKGY